MAGDIKERILLESTKELVRFALCLDLEFAKVPIFLLSSALLIPTFFMSLLLVAVLLFTTHNARCL